MARGNRKGSNQEHRDDNRRAYRDMPSVTNREWGPESRGAEQYSYGYRGQGGYDGFRDARQTDDGYQPGQGGYGEDQGRHAQSGHGRGGMPGQQDGRQQAGHTSRGTHRGRGPRNYTRSDQSIAEELIDRMTDHDGLDASEILLNVENAVVKLTGEVPQRRMKHLAEDLADEVRGVRDIENHIRVDKGASSFGPAGQAVRSGENQAGSGFSSSARIDDPLSQESIRNGRAGTESGAPERHGANRRGGND